MSYSSLARFAAARISTLLTVEARPRLSFLADLLQPEAGLPNR